MLGTIRAGRPKGFSPGNTTEPRLVRGFLLPTYNRLRAVFSFTAMTNVAHEHEQHETIVIDTFYPDHAPRTESALFRKTKHHLVAVLDTPCWVCGSKESREVHHFHAEWADADGIDFDKMRELHPGFDWSSYREPSDFIDSEYNMLVLCERHHRGKNHGIHLLPYPIWIMQRNQRADFIFSPDEIPTKE